MQTELVGLPPGGMRGGRGSGGRSAPYEDPAQIIETESALRKLMQVWKKGLGAEASQNVNFDAAVKAADERIATASLMNM